MMQLFNWQQKSAADMVSALNLYRVVADGSDTGTGKMYKACAVARSLGKALVVVCPKAVVPEWRNVAELFGVIAHVYNYEKVRSKKGCGAVGHWSVPGKVYTWTLPPTAILCFDEAHNCGGQKTQNSKLLIAAKRQGIPTILSSATLMANPLKGYAIGYALGLHKLTDFWTWAARHDVKQGVWGMEWAPGWKIHMEDSIAQANARKVRQTQIMENIRKEMGAKFTRIRKADVPGFPQNQIVPVFCDTTEMPDLVSDYSMEARQFVELEKVSAIAERTTELVEEEGMSVAIFVNFKATLDALHQIFPDAAVIRGGQTETERTTHRNRFQQNATPVILIMAQAGGTGLSLHDLHGRPRAAIISPGWSAVEFLQVLGRIHRAGALSPAVNYVLFASGVPVERRIRTRLEQKLKNLETLNDYDLESPNATGAAPGGASPEQAAPGHDANEHPVAQGAGSGQAAVPGHHGGADAHGTGEGAGGGEHQAAAPAQVLPLPAPTLQGEAGQLKTSAGLESLTSINMTTQQNAPVPNTPGQHGERKHARCSPSKLKNLEICPSYESDNSGPVHPITLRGTAMHEALETGDDSKLDPIDTFNPNGESRVEHNLVQMVRDYIEAEKEAYGVTEVVDEIHLKTQDPDVQGFVDRIMFGPLTPGSTRRKAYVRDYKFGFNLVDVPSINPQAIAYTVGIFLKYEDVDEVHFAFMIPRQDAILEHTFTRAELPTLQLRVATIAERVRKFSGQHFNVVEENCLYCGRKASCPKLHEKALVIANAYNEDAQLPLPAEFHSSLITDPVQMAKALNAVTVLEKWCESVRSHALKLRLDVGIEIPGWTLTERSGKRSVINPTAAFDLAVQYGVSDEEFMAACTVSLADLEKAVEAHAPKGQKAKKAQEFVDALVDQNAASRGNPYFLLTKERKKKAKPAATEISATPAE